jgi:adenylate kinase
LNLLLFGAPGAGKGTQSSLLSQRLGLAHISTGDLFRAEAKAATELGAKVKVLLDAGDLVPDALTISLIKSVISKLGSTGFILDGFPRTVAQAKALEELLESVGRRLDAVIFLSVPEAELTKRLTGRRVCSGCGKVFNIYFSPSRQGDLCDVCGGRLNQRSDDREEVIKNRLQRYEENTAVLKVYYGDKAVLREVDGTLGEELVYRSILEYLGK